MRPTSLSPPDDVLEFRVLINRLAGRDALETWRSLRAGLRHISRLGTRARRDLEPRNSEPRNLEPRDMEPRDLEPQGFRPRSGCARRSAAAGQPEHTGRSVTDRRKAAAEYMLRLKRQKIGVTQI